MIQWRGICRTGFWAKTSTEDRNFSEHKLQSDMLVSDVKLCLSSYSYYYFQKIKVCVFYTVKCAKIGPTLSVLAGANSALWIQGTNRDRTVRQAEKSGGGR